MRNQVKTLEDLFKLDSDSEGVAVTFRSENSTLIVRLSVGIQHYQFEMRWSDVKERYEHHYSNALRHLKRELNNARTKKLQA